MRECILGCLSSSMFGELLELAVGHHTKVGSATEKLTGIRYSTIPMVL